MNGAPQDFGSLFAGLVRVELVPRYRMNIEAPAAERISFVVLAPTVATMAEWRHAQGLAEVAAAQRLATIGEPTSDEHAAAVASVVAANADRSRVFTDQVIEVRHGAIRRAVSDANRDAFREQSFADRPELLVELELSWIRLGVVGAASGKG